MHDVKKTADKIKIAALIDKARFHRNISCNDKKAIKICNKILRIDINNRDAMLIKAGALGSCYNLDESKDLIASIIKKWPDHWEAYYLSAMNHFSMNEDEKAFELIDKSLELDENFNNLMNKAQMIYLTGKGDYMELVEKARKLDKKRADNFMKNHWIYDVNDVKPTFSELSMAIKSLTKLKRK